MYHSHHTLSFTLIQRGASIHDPKIKSLMLSHS